MRYFLPKEDPRRNIPAAIKADGLDWEQCQQLQSQGYGAYLVVNGPGHRDEEIDQCRAIFVEFDDRPVEEQILFWQDLGLPEPTLQIKTRKSVHTYWRIECNVEAWRGLQSDLLAHTGGDASLKNPSRVMRLAGSYHFKSGEEPTLCEVIHSSDRQYTYEELRQAIPPQPQQQEVQPRYNLLTTDDAIPLEKLLTLRDRALIESGSPDGNRNNAGAKLARNLIGTAKYCDLLGHRYDADPRSLFDYYCSRCTPALSRAEANQIWKSAEKDNPRPSLTPEAIEKNIRVWRSKQSKEENVQLAEAYKEQAVDQQESEDEYSLICSAVASTLDIPDLFKQELLQRRLATQYKLPTDYIQKLAEHMRRQKEKETKGQTSFTLQEILEMPLEAQSWLVPGLIPFGDQTIIGAAPGEGKSLMAYDLAYAVATGTEFLGQEAHQGKVLYYALEESIFTIQKRLYQRGFDGVEDGEILIIEREFDMFNLEPFEQRIQETGASLIVLDSYRKIHSSSGIDENHADFSKLAYRLQGVAQKLNVAIVVVHHHNKSQADRLIDRLAGSGALPGACSTILQMERTNPAAERDTRRRLSVTKQRDSEPTAYEIKLNLTNYHWDLEQNLGISYEVHEAEGRILEVLNEIAPNGMEGADIAAKLADTSKTIVYRALNKLTERSVITLRRIPGTKRRVYSIDRAEVVSPQDIEPDISFSNDYEMEPDISFSDNAEIEESINFLNGYQEEEEEPVVYPLPEPPLTEGDIIDAQEIIDLTDETNAAEVLKALTEAFTGERKAQLWQALTETQRQKLQRLSTLAKQREVA